LSLHWRSPRGEREDGFPAVSRWVCGHPDGCTTPSRAVATWLSPPWTSTGFDSILFRTGDQRVCRRGREFLLWGRQLVPLSLANQRNRIVSDSFRVTDWLRGSDQERRPGLGGHSSCVVSSRVTLTFWNRTSAEACQSWNLFLHSGRRSDAVVSFQELTWASERFNQQRGYRGSELEQFQPSRSDPLPPSNTGVWSEELEPGMDSVVRGGRFEAQD